MDRLQGSFWFDLDSVFDHLLAYYQSVIKTFFTLLIVPLTKVWTAFLLHKVLSAPHYHQFRIWFIDTYVSGVVRVLLDVLKVEIKYSYFITSIWK